MVDVDRIDPTMFARLQTMIATARSLTRDEAHAYAMVSSMAELMALGGGPRRDFRPLVRAVAGKEPRLSTTA